MATQTIILTATAVDLVSATPVDLVRGENYTLQIVTGSPAYFSEGGEVAPSEGHRLVSWNIYTLTIPTAGKVWVWGDGKLAVTEAP